MKLNIPYKSYIIKRASQFWRGFFLRRDFFDNKIVTKIKSSPKKISPKKFRLILVSLISLWDAFTQDKKRHLFCLRCNSLSLTFSRCICKYLRRLFFTVNRTFAPIRLFIYMRIKKYITERYSLPKALLLYLTLLAMIIVECQCLTIIDKINPFFIVILSYNIYYNL